LLSFHCLATRVPEFVILKESQGIGYDHFFCLYSLRADSIEEISDCLLVSLLLSIYEENETKPIVESIANIVTTTMSSVKEKALIFLLFIIINK